MAWRPTTDFEEEIVDFQPDHNFIFASLADEPEICYPRPKEHLDFVEKERQRKKVEQEKHTLSQNNKLEMIAKVQHIAGTKRLGELTTIDDWNDDEHVEKETIALMRHFGFGPSIEAPLNEKCTAATHPISEEVKIMRRGSRRIPILFDEKFFKLKPRVKDSFSDDKIKTERPKYNAANSTDSKETGQSVDATGALWKGNEYSSPKHKKVDIKGLDEPPMSSKSWVSETSNWGKERSFTKSKQTVPPSLSNGQKGQSSTSSKQTALPSLSKGQKGQFITNSKQTDSPSLSKGQKGQSSTNSKQTALPSLSKGQKGQSSTNFKQTALPSLSKGQKGQSFTNSKQTVSPGLSKGRKGQSFANSKQTVSPILTKEQKGQAFTSSKQTALPSLSKGQKGKSFTNSKQTALPSLSKGQKGQSFTNSKQTVSPSLSNGQKGQSSTNSKQTALPSLSKGQKGQSFTNSKQTVSPNLSKGQKNQSFTNSKQTALPSLSKGQKGQSFTNSKQTVSQSLSKGQKDQSFTYPVQTVLPNKSKKIGCNISLESVNSDNEKRNFSSYPQGELKFFTPRELYEMKKRRQKKD